MTNLTPTHQISLVGDGGDRRLSLESLPSLNGGGTGPNGCTIDEYQQQQQPLHHPVSTASVRTTKTVNRFQQQYTRKPASTRYPPSDYISEHTPTTNHVYTGAHTSHGGSIMEKAPVYKYPGIATSSPVVREMLAEMLGTLVLVMFGDGAVASKVLYDGMGSWLGINICYGIALMLGIYVAGGVSGAHLNPAVSLTLAIFGRFEWRKVLPYWLAQFFGAFFGAAIVYGVYYQPLHAKIASPEIGGVYDSRTAGIFTTYPGANVNNYAAFLTEMVCTACLIGGIFAICDQYNLPASKYTKAAAIGLLLGAIGMSFGTNTGYGANPARDFGPRVFTAIAGWGSYPFTAYENYFWVPILAPFIGGILGAGIYELMIEAHHPIFEDELDKDNTRESFA